MRPFLILACLLVFSCGQGSSNLHKVNLDKALRRQVSCHELYSSADVIPLHCPVGTSLGQEGRLVMDVAADRFFLLDLAKNEILVFDWNGAFVTSIGSDETIIDFSAYGDSVLDVLTQGAITEYAVDDGSLIGTYPILDNEVILKSVAKVDGDSIFMLGCLNGDAYDCGYTKRGFHAAARPSPDYLATHRYSPASEIQNSRFFRCDGLVYSFQSHSGEIFRYTDDDFLFPVHVMDFGGRPLSITNVQKSSDILYLTFESEGTGSVLIYDLDRKKYKTVRPTTDGAEFPLGVIYDSCNYFCCPASSLSRYLPVEQADGTAGPVVIRFSL